MRIHYKRVSPRVVQAAVRGGTGIWCGGSLAVCRKTTSCRSLARNFGRFRSYTASHITQLSDCESEGSPIALEYLERIQSTGKVSLGPVTNEAIIKAVASASEHEKHELLSVLEDICEKLDKSIGYDDLAKLLDLASSRKVYYDDPVLSGPRHEDDFGSNVMKTYLLIAVELYKTFDLKGPGLHKRITSLLVDLRSETHLEWMLENWPEDCTISDTIVRVRAYGLVGDHKSAYETLKRYTSSNDESVSKVGEAHASLISAYFDCNERLSAMQYFERLLRERSGPNISFELGKIVDAMVKGFANVGDFAAVWNWIKRAENDPKIPPVSIPALVGIFSQVCANNQHELAANLFDYLASRKDCMNFEEFNRARSDYLMLAIKGLRDTQNLRSVKWGFGSQSIDYVQKVVKEVRLRQGILDHYTLLEVVGVLIDEGYPEFAMDLFQTQSIRINSYILKKDMKLEWFQHIHRTCVLNVLELLKEGDYLTHKTLVPLLSSGFINQYSKIDIAPILEQVEGLQDTCILEPQDLLLFYTRMMEFGAKSIKDEFFDCIRLVIDNGIPIHDYTLNEVKRVLRLAGFDELSGELSKSVNLCDPILEMSIRAYAETSDNSFKSLKMFEESVRLRKTISSDTVISLILNGDRDVVCRVYELAMHCHHLKTCVMLHRAVIHRGVQPIMGQAYQRLIDMGSFPDNTGYVRLMSQTSSADKAMSLYNEALSNKISPNNSMINVLLSRLRRKKRFVEAGEIYRGMEVYNVPRTNETYLIMLRVAHDTNDEALAKSIFKEVEKSTVVATVELYNLMMQFYVHQRPDRESALKVFDQIANHTCINPSAQTYQLLIEAYTLIRPVDLQAADQVLNMIVRDRSIISTRHYAALIRARGVISRDLRAAQEFYDSLVFRNRVKPCATIFEALMESYVVCGKTKETLTLLQDLAKYNVDINPSLGNLLLKAWSAVDINKTAELFRFLQAHKVTNTQSYELLFRVYVDHDHFYEAENLLAHMKEIHLPEESISTAKALLESATK